MKEIMKIELERAFKNKLFWIALLGGIICFSLHIFRIVIPDAFLLRNIEWQDPIIAEIYSQVQLPNLYMDYSGIYLGSFTLAFYFILPILTCIPYSMSIYTDSKSHYINQLVLRVGNARYQFAKLITQFIVCGVIAVMPMIFSFVGTAMLLPSVLPEISSPTYLIYDKIIFSNLFYNLPLLYVLLSWCINFIGFGLIGCLSFALSDVVENRFMTALAPFMLYFCQHVMASSFGKSSIKNALILVGTNYTMAREAIYWFVAMIIIIIVAYTVKVRRQDLL